MAGLQNWNGSSFVDGQPRLWNGSTFVAPSACHIWDGTKFAKVWPNFQRQRMNKSGTFTMTYNSPRIVTGWASDGTYPATITSDQLIVAGGGTATAFVSWTATGGYGYRMNLRQNGTVLGYQDRGFNSSGTFTFSVTVTLAEGDKLDLYVSNFSASGGDPQVTAGYVDIVPA